MSGPDGNGVEPPSSDEIRNRMLDSWQLASKGWAEQADGIRAFGMPVSTRMIELLDLKAGQQVLELAAGPGDTGFMAAELISPGGTLVCSDATDGMLEIARARAAAQGVENVEFAQLQLEWIDRETASFDAVLCRWGVMLILDPEAALRECRRVLRPGGRLVLAVWDAPAANPWATIPQRALLQVGAIEAPAADGPGMFALADPGRLEGMLRDAGFVEPVVESVALSRSFDSVDGFMEETHDCSAVFAGAWAQMRAAERAALTEAITAATVELTADDGSITLPGSSLVAVAEA